MIIYVISSLDGKKISLNVEPSDIIKHIKELIYKKEKFDICKQILIFAGMPLDNNSTLADYNIHKEATLHLIFQNNENFFIFVNFLGKKKISIKVNINEKIKSIKEKIKESEKIEIDEQNLLFCNKLLENEKIINNYSIEENDIIICITFDKYLYIKSEEENIKIRYNENDTVIDLKIKISKKCRTFRAFQCDLMYNKTILEDDQILKDYNIPNKSTIEVILPKSDKLVLNLRSGFGKEKQNKEITKEYQYSDMNQIFIDKIIELEQLLNAKKNKKGYFVSIIINKSLFLSINKTKSSKVICVNFPLG